MNTVLQRNGYFAYPTRLMKIKLFENFVFDEFINLSIAKNLMTMNLIWPKARSEHEMDSNMQLFSVPFFKFGATKYYNRNDWQAFKVTDPSVTNNTLDIELQRMIAAQELPKYIFSQFSCHTQAVEKCAKLVTAASAIVCWLDLYPRKLILSMQYPRFLRNVITSCTVNNLFYIIRVLYLLNWYK